MKTKKNKEQAHGKDFNAEAEQLRNAKQKRALEQMFGKTENRFSDSPTEDQYRAKLAGMSMYELQNECLAKSEKPRADRSQMVEALCKLYRTEKNVREYVPTQASTPKNVDRTKSILSRMQS